MRFIFIILIFIGNLFSQQKIINLTELPFDRDFMASHLNVSNTGIYLLDRDNRQISFIDNNNTIYNAGGYGTAYDAFIDPINILTSKLKVWVVDRTENKLITFDSKLNFISIVEFANIYPTLCANDDWGNVYLFSETENKIFRIPFLNKIMEEFIDLSIYNIDEKSVSELYIAKDGSIAIMDRSSVFTFSRLGRFELKIPLGNADKFVFKRGKVWYGVSSDNTVINLINKEKYKLMVPDQIIDFEYLGNKYYLLLHDQIWIIDENLE